MAAERSAEAINKVKCMGVGEHRGAIWQIQHLTEISPLTAVKISPAPGSINDKLKRDLALAVGSSFNLVNIDIDIDLTYIGADYIANLKNTLTIVNALRKALDYDKLQVVSSDIFGEEALAIEDGALLVTFDDNKIEFCFKKVSVILRDSIKRNLETLAETTKFTKEGSDAGAEIPVCSTPEHKITYLKGEATAIAESIEKATQKQTTTKSAAKC